jgi:hypothetical protein
MQKVNRRSAVALGSAAAASTAVVKPAAAQTTGYKTRRRVRPWRMPWSAISEREFRVEQDGKTFTAKKDFVWTCNKDTKEQSFNDGRVVAIMRITDLKA